MAAKINLGIGDTKLLVDEARHQGLLRKQTAYLLATVFHETAATMKPIREMGGEAYLKSKSYYPYVGMGYVQLTWLDNYLKAGRYLGVDFAKNPKLLLEAKYATPIAIVGMVNGWFTGKKLADYISEKKADFFNARSIINGDKNYVHKPTGKKIGDLIAGYATVYDTLLEAAGYDKVVVPTPTPAPAPVDKPATTEHNTPTVWEWIKSTFSRLFS